MKEGDHEGISAFMAQESHNVILLKVVKNKLQNFIVLTKQKFVSETYKIQLAAGLCYLLHTASKVPLEVNTRATDEDKGCRIASGSFHSQAPVISISLTHISLAGCPSYDHTQLQGLLEHVIQLYAREKMKYI